MSTDDKMNVDVDPSSSLPSPPLTEGHVEVDQVPPSQLLNKTMAEYSKLIQFGILIKNAAGDVLTMKMLLSVVLMHLLQEVAEMDLGAGMIPPQSHHKTLDLLKDLNDDDFEKWVVAAKNDDWESFTTYSQLKNPIPETPPNPPWDPKSFQHTPPKPREEFDAVIEIFLTQCRPQMKTLVENAHHVPLLLPSWKPNPSVDKQSAEHISRLCIPMDQNGRPSLLLHDLGEERNDLDRERVTRIPEIFSAGHRVLINTSGSGKTRLLLEGLCRWWGFYFVAQPDRNGTGSGDLWKVISGLDEAQGYKEALATKEADPKASAAINHIRETVERRLAQLILARFLLLNLLIQEAQKLPGGLQEKEHRRLWVILQAQPQILGRVYDVDIFSSLTQRLKHASFVDLKDRIFDQYTQLSILLTNDQNPTSNNPPPLFCVLDEAQITTTLHRGEFISDDYFTQRPVLREIWLAWTQVLQSYQMRLILSGTGIEFKVLANTLDSPALKLEPYQVKFDIGAFEKRGSQAEYIKHYVPACWTEAKWIEFLNRAWGWFHGRYRSTATLISLMLETGFQSPHKMIDAYVEAFTDFQPTDGKPWIDLEPDFPNHFQMENVVTRLKFEKMNEMQASTLSIAIYDQILYGRYSLSAFASADRATFVEYGFARHKSTIRDTVIDEPLAILAALQWVNKSAKLSLFECLRHDIGRHSKRKNGFEAYLAFYLRKVFEMTPELDAVFTFRKDFAGLPWCHDKFELVTVSNPGNGSDPLISVVTPSCGPSSNVGFLANSGEEVLEWISTNKDQFTFCFPPESFGPDLLLFLRSKVSGKLLLVVIQCKKCDSVKKQVLIHGVRTVTPSWFWKSKDKKHRTAATAPPITNDNNDCLELIPKTANALANIPLGLKVELADYPVLRIFASWEGDPKLERSDEWREADEVQKGAQEETKNGADTDRHPLATLHGKNFRASGEEMDVNWFRGDVEQKLVVHLKRAGEEQESRRRKSARLAQALIQQG